MRAFAYSGMPSVRKGSNFALGRPASHNPWAIQGKTVAVAVAAGEVEIGIQQTNVIQPVAGTQYLGPLPPDLIEYGHFGVAVRNVSKNEAVARDFIKFMTSPAGAALLRKSAMEPSAQ